MKKFYFSKSNLGKDYFFDSGLYSKRREVLGKEEDKILSYFMKKFDKKRKSEIYVLKSSVSEEFFEKICSVFENTDKVKVVLEDSFD